MSENEPLVRHISDTALWAAMHRAKETERPDAKFQDPFARQLAGERGEQIAAALAIPEADSWSWMARTYLFDQFITDQIQRGTDMVVNVAAGLDARPYRMALPRSLAWIEIDLPDVLDYKKSVLAAHDPHCNLERIPLDLTDVHRRRAVFQSLRSKAAKALVLAEGLMIYLTEDNASLLAEDLAAIPVFRFWLLDLASPGLLAILRAKARDQFRDAGVLQFAPGNGPEFFAAHKWKVVNVQSLLQTAGRLNRLPEAMRQLALVPEDPIRVPDQPWAGVCLLERS